MIAAHMICYDRDQGRHGFVRTRARTRAGMHSNDTANLVTGLRTEPRCGAWWLTASLRRRGYLRDRERALRCVTRQ